MLRSQKEFSCEEECVSREEAFIKNTKDVILHIVTERLEKPPMFIVRELMVHFVL